MDARQKPYRFLLRLPEDVREDLVEASRRSGSSLNSEIVDRLQRSLLDERRAAARWLVVRRARRASLALVATGAAVLAAAFALATESPDRSPGRMQVDAARLGAKLAQTASVADLHRG
jgi:hypothetical protein